MIQAPVVLGGVDGFHQDEAAGERDEGGVVLGRFLAAQDEAFEALELAHGLLDAGAVLVEGLGEGGGLFRIFERSGITRRTPQSRAARRSALAS